MEGYEKVTQMSDEEIVSRIDQGSANVAPGIDLWYRELSRRQGERASVRAERLTLNAVWLTVANVVVALVTAGAAVLALRAG